MQNTSATAYRVKVINAKPREKTYDGHPTYTIKVPTSAIFENQDETGKNQNPSNKAIEFICYPKYAEHLVPSVSFSYMFSII